MHSCDASIGYVIVYVPCPLGIPSSLSSDSVMLCHSQPAHHCTELSYTVLISCDMYCAVGIICV